MSIDPLGQSLLTIARNAIGHPFGVHANTVTPHPALAHLAATFVTLNENNELRGCMGTLEAHRPLAMDVAENAFAAAFSDPRFDPLDESELNLIKVEVSLLDTPQMMSFKDEEDLLGKLCPGADGIILSYGAHRATFLPQVWESLPEPMAFLSQLKRKAGLATNFWDPAICITRYGVQKWKEK